MNGRVIWQGKLQNAAAARVVAYAPSKDNAIARCVAEIETKDALGGSSWVQAQIIGGEGYATSIYATATLELAGVPRTFAELAAKPS
jgi:hypothetical protein